MVEGRPIKPDWMQEYGLSLDSVLKSFENDNREQSIRNLVAVTAGQLETNGNIEKVYLTLYHWIADFVNSGQDIDVDVASCYLESLKKCRKMLESEGDTCLVTALNVLILVLQSQLSLAKNAVEESLSALSESFKRGRFDFYQLC